MSNLLVGPVENTENLLACHQKMASLKPPDAAGEKKKKKPHNLFKSL